MCSALLYLDYTMPEQIVKRLGTSRFTQINIWRLIDIPQVIMICGKLCSG